MARDASTAPLWLRPLQLGALVGLAAYFVFAYGHSLTSPPPWIAFGAWQMFTLNEPGGSEMVIDVQVDGEWRALDVDAVLPSRWDSGYRFSRGSFRRSAPRLSVLGASVCWRYERVYGVTPDQVRFRELRWRKVVGSMARAGLREEEIRRFRCGREVALPRGRTVPLPGERP